MPRAPLPLPAAEHTAQAPDNLFAGTSGWAYPTWKPGFYPATVPAREFLNFYASQLNAVEVNYTFRTLPSVPQLQGWLHATPPGFRFSFKAPQRITHFARLRSCGDELGRLLAALEPAREAGRMGPLLFQLPPNFAADPARLAAFLAEPALRDGTLSAEQGAVRIAFEFRHPSWFCDEIYDLLRAHEAALCVADTDDLQTPDVATAPFRCYRLRRDGGYTPAELQQTAARLSAFAAEGEVYAFFRHQEEPTGALNARQMLAFANSRATPTAAEEA